MHLRLFLRKIFLIFILFSISKINQAQYFPRELAAAENRGSVILMIIVISLTVIQFRYIERRVHYA